MFERIIARFRDKKESSEAYEFCPRCEANLTMQKGYSNELPYWICRGCGEMLINPSIEDDSNIVWLCDECGAMLNIQSGFDAGLPEWKCLECGYLNSIDERDLYASEDEYQEELKNPYRGLSDEDALRLGMYRDVENVDGRKDVILVEDMETSERYIKKILWSYDKSIYEYLMAHPVEHMPKVYGIYEGANCLIVLEQLIEGDTVEKILRDGPMAEDRAVSVALDVCRILEVLHGLPRPIIHRDIKPSNIMITPDDEVYLLDMDVAKWYNPEKNDDTRYMGTQNYAAPEQAGFGLTASSAKSDIYGVGMLLNVMVTDHYPKQQKAAGRLWEIIERCISLDADKRYTDAELIEALVEIGN